MVEVAGDERDVDVAGFANGLAIVESFEDGEAAGVFLDLAGESVEVTRAGVGSERLPRGESGVNSAGLMTTVLPAARAGATFQANMRRGKFQGMIWPTTPQAT